jgi:opacity protein-like surface antigen
MKRLIGFLVVTLWLGAVAFAQDNPKAEITGDYSYFRANPGLPSYFNSQNLNGGGGQATFYMTKWLGFAADLQGYGSYTQCTKPGAPVSGCAQGNLFTYMFGPQIKYRAGKLEPFAEVLLGGAHSNFYANGCTNVGICGSKSPSNNAFSMAIGGGVDIAVSPKFAIRLVDADYDLTRFGNNFTGGNNSQSNFRFQTGVQFRF